MKQLRDYDFERDSVIDFLGGWLPYKRMEAARGELKIQRGLMMIARLLRSRHPGIVICFWSRNN